MVVSKMGKAALSGYELKAQAYIERTFLRRPKTNCQLILLAFRLRILKESSLHQCCSHRLFSVVLFFRGFFF